MTQIKFKKEIMEISHLQKQVDDWIKRHGVRYFDEMTNLAVLMEEVGELARIFSREFGEQSYKKGSNKGSLSDEMADVMFVLVCLANQTGVDLEQAMKDNFNKKTSRDHNRHHENKKLKESKR